MHLRLPTLLLCLAAAAATGEDSIRVTPSKHIDILRDGKTLVRYMHAYDTSSDQSTHNTYKVYHHVFDPSGEQPITKGPGGKFTHHRGLFIGFSRTRYDGKTYDLWHMKNQCRQIHQRTVLSEADDKSTTLTTQINWDIAPGKTILSEERTIQVHHTDSEAHLLADWTSELTAVDGDVTLAADPEHGGMQYRPSNEVAENKSAQYTFPREGIDLKKDKDLPWVALTYQLGDQSYSVQQLRHPDNPDDSVYSAYRDYGRFGNYFVTTIKDGETLKLRYRFRITLGGAPSREALAAQYRAYVGQ